MVSSGKLALVLREEMTSFEKTHTQLGDEDSGRLKDALVNAFNHSARKECSMVLTAILDDTAFLSTVDTEDLCEVIVSNQGIILHSFGTTAVIETKGMKTLTFILMGGANSIACAPQFMALKKKQQIQKAATPKKPSSKKSNGKKTPASKAPAPAPALRRSGRAKAAPAPAPAPAKRGGKKPAPTVIVLDSPLHSTDGLQQLDSPIYHSRTVEILSDSESVNNHSSSGASDSDSDSDSDGAHKQLAQ